MADFLQTLRSGPVLLMDGAMGTELQRAGLGEGECGEGWNLTQPERVRAVHRSYILSGALCLLTNTFQSNPLALARHGLADRLEEINHAAVGIARSVCGAGHFVLASIGPVTSETLRKAGFPPTLEAHEFTMDGLVKAITEFVSHTDPNQKSLHRVE